MEPTDDRSGFAMPGPPDRIVSANDVVSLNMAYFRKAAGLSQQELADRIGWLKSVVSTAERTWDAKRTRNFTADDLVEMASALGLPVTAFFLPPEDDGVIFRYVLHKPHGELQPLRDLLPLIIGEAEEGDSPVMTAYRNRLGAAGAWPSNKSLDRAAQILTLAQQAADEAIRTARNESDETLTRLRSEGESVLGRAQQYAEQITADARARAEALERDAQERHRQAVIGLITAREQLERRVDDLRAFEREYRTRLVSFLERSYSELWSGVEGAEDAEAVERLRTRAAQLGASRYTVLLLSEDGTYDSLTSEDLESPDEDEPRKGAAEDEGAPPEGWRPEGWSREAWEQAEVAVHDLRMRGIPGPYLFADKDGVITVTPAAAAAEEAPEEGTAGEGERLPPLLLPRPGH